MGVFVGDNIHISNRFSGDPSWGMKKQWHVNQNAFDDENICMDYIDLSDKMILMIHITSPSHSH